MTIDLDDLEAKARAATPIDWTFEEPTKDAFIHAANPAVVLELVQRLRAAERKIDAVRDWADVHEREKHKSECACVAAMWSFAGRALDDPPR